MDKDALSLSVSKDLFIEAWKSVPDLCKYPSQPKGKHEFRELDLFADKFIAFHKRLQSKLNE